MRKFLLDADEVLFKFNSTCLKHLAIFRGVEAVDISNWNSWSVFSLMSKEESDFVWDKLSELGTAQDLELVEGTVGSLKWLRTVGQVLIVSSPLNTPTWCFDRLFALKELGFSKNEVIFTAGKEHVPGDIFVDDKIENILAWRQIWPNSLAIFREWPNTKGAVYSGPRAGSWSEIISIIKERFQL